VTETSSLSLLNNLVLNWDGAPATTHKPPPTSHDEVILFVGKAKQQSKREKISPHVADG
jgi:hypothetical protein